MVKKVLIGLTSLACALGSQGIYAAETVSSAAGYSGSSMPQGQTNGQGDYLAPVEPRLADEEMQEKYANNENAAISTQSARSEYEIYAELERRAKDAMLKGETSVDISDLNVTGNLNMIPYFYGYSPYFYEGTQIYLYYMSDGQYVEMEIQNALTVEQTKTYFAQVDAKLAFYQSLVNDGMTQEQKALTIHDYIVSHSQYDTSYSIYGCDGIFMYGVGVCQSYACTYMYILNALGMECYFVPSDAMNHGWNIVRIDGQYYHVDCTFDDPTPDSFGMADHDYFLLSDTAMTQLDYYSWNAQGRTCTSNAYANAFWRESNSPVVLANGNSYYIASDGYTLVERNNSTGAETSLTDIYDNDTGLYAGLQDIGLFYYDGSICYNTSDQIIEYDLSDGINYAVYDLEDSIGGVIEGCREENGVITFKASDNPFTTVGNIYQLNWNDGWVKTDDGWVYSLKGKPARGWKKIDQNWYYFDADGIMLSSQWVGAYYLKEDGTMAHSEWVDDGQYYVNENGVWEPNPGQSAKWRMTNGRWWYQHADGSYTTNGWEKIDNEWYYFDASGYMKASSWIGNYYVKANGTMARSECVDDNKYYVDANGVWDSSKVAEWKISNGRWWYKHADGGYTVNNWERIGGEWYYFDASGYMASSRWIGSYYVKEDGTMAHSEWVDNGKYYVDENGVWVP